MRQPNPANSLITGGYGRIEALFILFSLGISVALAVLVFVQDPGMAVGTGTAVTSNDDEPFVMAATTGPGPLSTGLVDERASVDLSIKGQVQDDRGSRLRGVSVRARPLELDTPIPEPIMTRLDASTAGALALDVHTRDDGTFLFEPPTAGTYSLSVPDSASHYAGRVHARTGARDAAIWLQRKRSVMVTGQVSDDAGDPLEGTLIRPLGSSQLVETDASGRYEITIELRKASQVPVLEFSRGGFQESLRRVARSGRSDFERVHLDVHMASAAPQVIVSGKVSGPNGESLGGVRVWLSSPDPQVYRRTISDDWGEFHIHGVDIGGPYRLGVEPGSGYLTYVSDPFPVGPGDTGHDVHLQRVVQAGLEGSPAGRWNTVADSGP